MKDEARVYRCGECGGPNPENHRFCEFCRAPIATLRCAGCYHMNVPDSRNCSACGEILGLAPVSSPSELLCPECQVPCDALEGDPDKLYDCPRCGGQFVEPRLLFDLLERRRRFMKPGPKPAGNPLDYAIRYLPCPVCQQMMQRRNFGGTSGIIVDLCAQHGTWFQHGELSRVLAYVEAGGLADARRYRLGLPKPQTLEDQKRIAQAIATSMGQASGGGSRGSGAKGSGAGGAGGADERPLDAKTIALEMVESSLDLLATLGEWVVGDRR